MSPHSTKVERVCEQCGKPFLVYPSAVASRPCRFCSTSCGITFRHARKRESFRQTFFAKVIIPDGPDAAGRCWEWRSAAGTCRYGTISYAGRVVKAPRVSWELHFGPIPKGEGYHGTCVLHTCDNPPCVNPAHLFLGTPGDNTRDRIAKGRSCRVFGERNGRAKLTREKVEAIRQDLASGMSSLAVGRKYGISSSTALRIKHRQYWAS